MCQDLKDALFGTIVILGVVFLSLNLCIVTLIFWKWVGFLQ